MCQLKNCKYAEIIYGMPSDKTMYIHHDEKLNPFWINYYDRYFLIQKKKTVKKRRNIKFNTITNNLIINSPIKLRRKTCKNQKIFDPTVETYYN